MATYFLFLDLETTGLDERDGHIAELAFKLTTQDLQDVLTQGHYVFHVSPDHWRTKVDKKVLQMHTASGLLAESVLSTRVPSHVDTCLYDEVFRKTRVADASATVVLAGNSVHFDLRWISHHMPNLRKILSYRILDVTSLEYLFDVSARGQELTRTGAAHRAIPDVDWALAKAREYRGMACGILPKQGSEP